MQEQKDWTEEQLKKAIVEEQEAQSVLKHVLQLLHKRTIRQKQSQKQKKDQHDIQELQKQISEKN